MKRFLLLSAFMSTLFISACGSSSSSFPGGDNRVSAQGVVYPIVVGLSYETNSGSGEVASDGSYTYKENENVTFSAGGIELVTVPATAQVTPLPLDDDIASTNLLRLLKALDTDGD